MAEKLLYQIEQEDVDIFEGFHQFEDLLGIFLGFGNHNAKLFQQREEIEKQISATKFWSLSAPQ